MIEGTLQWAAEVMMGSGDPLTPVGEFHGVCTDTRQIKPGELFFCLLGNRDGHEFAAMAMKNGASALVIDQEHGESDPQLKSFPHIIVKDTLYALGELAHAWRKKFHIPIIALTGSNGKTTTKELLKAILDQKFETLATQGNFNNLIGVPKTLFGLGREHEIAVIEMGMNDFGEIRRLTEITHPTLGLITNIGEAHLEKLGDLNGVARAKGELFAGLSKEAVAIYNMNDPLIAEMETRARRFPLGTRESGHWAEFLEPDPEHPLPQQVQVHWEGETHNISLPLPGRHNLGNLLLAVAVGRHFGIGWDRIKNALKNFRAAPSRMELLRLGEERWLLDDCYNANPSSTEAALKTLAQLKQDQAGLAVLGDMNELGEASGQGHHRIGRKVVENGVEHLVAVGKFSSEFRDGALEGGMNPNHIRTYRNVEELAKIEDILPPEVKWILVKGSRTNHLEKLVTRIKEKH